MKKVISVVLVLIMLISCMSLSVSANENDKFADELKEMGLFLGSDNGYELDRYPTRAEAAVMLVRMLGKEAEAKTNKTYSHVFNDVPDWASSHVAYLYTKKITKGYGNEKFGANDKCDASMFATFTLRALGYSESEGDFKYDNAIDLAISKGIMKSTNKSGVFTRGDCVYTMYKALSAKLKNSSITLKDKLITDGVITIKDNESALEELNNILINSKLNSKESISMQLDMEVVSGSLTTNSKMVIDMIIKKEIEYAITLRMDVGVMIMNVKQYCKDGWLYSDLDGFGKVKEKLGTSVNEMMDMNSITSSFNLSNDIIKDVTKDTSNGKTTYTAILNNSKEFYDLFGEAGYIYGGSVVYTIINNDISSMSMDLDMADENGVDMRIKLIATILATGEDVKIIYPDFSEFKQP